MANDTQALNVSGSLANMGVSDFISNLAVGIARGQFALDQACMDMATFMGNAEIAFGKRPDSDEPDMMSLLELGFTPNFYQFTETSIEVRVAISSQFQKNSEMAVKDQQQTTTDTTATGTVTTGTATANKTMNYSDMSLTSVDAKYSSSYNYKAEASSVIKTKITPVPAPAVFEEILQGKLAQRREEQARARWKLQVQNISTLLFDGSNAILADVTGLAYPLPDLINDPAAVPLTGAEKTAIATVIQTTMDTLIADYSSFTTDHWAIIDNLQQRQTLDNSLKEADDELQLMISEAPLDTPLVTFDTRIANMTAKITLFKNTIQAVYDRLFPPAV